MNKHQHKRYTRQVQAFPLNRAVKLIAMFEQYGQPRVEAMRSAIAYVNGGGLAGLSPHGRMGLNAELRRLGAGAVLERARFKASVAALFR